ncbi:putative AP superfamily protein [Caldisphaera lagunensis DSM 15908]|uniref:Putative AP superfamily protein n=1 Tax=Caldisphaera lagunensis (strain DSM 15908 / JCM 11604 / ANMR 0165 / IC-154) TaxID=1056495 RepID=L0A900_CALLD|nr:alkaline phosphatase family protein [Caldisphaera lagunensis]AFZ69904.1 putative AP superfamily protein [Caldisphaera lagunensis DSM 15908]
MELDLEYPDYDNNMTIYGLSCGLAKFFDVKRNCMVNPIAFQGNKLVFIFIDGLGWELFNRLNIEIKGEVNKIKTVFPSTTSTVTTTLFTGQTPGEHGVLGYIMFNKKLGGIINTLRYNYVGEPINDSIKQYMGFIKAFPVKPWIHETNKKILTIIQNSISNTEFTNTLHRDLNRPDISYLVGYFNSTDMIINLIKSLSSNQYDGIFVYYDAVDHLGHSYGYNNEFHDFILYDAKYVLENLINVAYKFRDKYTFVLFADHGQITVKKTVVWNNDKELLDMLEVPPYGDSRAIWFRSRYNIKKYLEDKYNLLVFDKNEIIDSKLLGKVENEVMNNYMGDYLGISKDNETKYLYTYRENDPGLNLKGNHSGLTKEEMYVPLIII